MMLEEELRKIFEENAEKYLGEDLNTRYKNIIDKDVDIGPHEGARFQRAKDIALELLSPIHQFGLLGTVSYNGQQAGDGTEATSYGIMMVDNLEGDPSTIMVYGVIPNEDTFEKFKSRLYIGSKVDLLLFDEVLNILEKL